MQWAHALGSTATYRKVMGLCYSIDSSSWKSNGPKRSHRRQLQQMQWAHPRTSAAAHKERNGPLRSHWQLPQQMLWAHPRASAAALRKVMGPNETIGESCIKSNVPILGHLQQLTKKGTGPCKAIGNCYIKYSGPML